MTKAEALHAFMSSFGITAYPNEAETGAAFPYLVYEQVLGSIDDGSMPLVVNLWYYGDSLLPIVNKTEEISKAIGLGGVYVPCDGGALLIQRGSPFSQPQTDAADNKIKGRYINVTVDFLTQN